MSGEVDMALVESVLADRFGLAGRLFRLPGEFDVNWRLDAGERSYTVRLSPPGRDPESLIFELDVLAHLTEAGLGFAIPEPVSTRMGEMIVAVDGDRLLRVLTWVPGTPYGDGRRTAALDRELGSAAGNLAAALVAIEGRDRAEIPWDLRRLESHADARAATIADPSRRQLLLRTVARAVADLAGRELPLALVHNDLNDLNVLTEGEVVTGVIDFGDMMRTYRAAEPAIAACYAMLGRHDPLSAGARVIEAFSRRVPLGEDEAGGLYSLVTGRLAMSAAQAASQEGTGNAHQQVSVGPVWELLERLDDADHDWCRATLEAAAGGGRPPAPPETSLAAARAARLGPSLSLSYREPLNIVRGRGALLSDRRGRRFLDCVNNVAHVGHAHPAVVEAGVEQMRRLNTNTRYLHRALATYAERLLEHFPPSMEVAFLVNSGSEANELAVRLARAATGRHAMAVLDHAYHGNTTTTVALSPYKFNGPGGEGKPDWVTVLPVPDSYRGPGVDAYRKQLEAALAGVVPAALIAESHSGCGGQLVPPPGTLAAAYQLARRREAVVIADEVQTGFGRVGEAFWAFELHGVVPDIVTLGKPIGNGHPLGAVVTSRSIAEAFDTGMEFFTTFGGNPVSAVIGTAVLDVIHEEGLQEHARVVGGHLTAALRDLATRHDVIGDVRGPGLFIGVDLVRDRTTKEPATRAAERAIEHAVSRGVLLSSDGPDRNVLKIKPPMVFSTEDADYLVGVLDEALSAPGRGD